MHVHLSAYTLRMDAPPEPTIAAWTRLATASRRVLERIEAGLRSAGLPPLAWYDALLEIERAGDDGIRPMALQERLLLPQYGTSRLLDRLAAEGLLERLPCPADGRGRIVRITGVGKALRRRMWPVYARALEGTIGTALSPEDATDLARLLDKVVQASRG